MASGALDGIGSPPHAWGDSESDRGNAALDRFTPTRVGRLRSAPPPCGSPPVHPHTRGEIPGGTQHRGPDVGSPPHAWGDFPRFPLTSGQGRFTPTRVGRFPAFTDRVTPLPVHPHTRGEIDADHEGSDAATGSPPHAWGDCVRHPQCHAHIRFTPTRVGRFRPACSPPARMSVHPHTRGEISAAATQLAKPIGSPPHAWGD